MRTPANFSYCTFKMAPNNDENLLWGVNFSRQVFLLKMIVLFFQQMLKFSYAERRRRRERWHRETVKRIESYSRWRARRNQRMFQGLLAELSRLRTVARSVWSRQRSGSWWDIIVEGRFEGNNWICNFWMSQRTFDFLCQELEPYLA